MIHSAIRDVMVIIILVPIVFVLLGAIGCGIIMANGSFKKFFYNAGMFILAVIALLFTLIVGILDGVWEVITRPFRKGE